MSKLLVIFLSLAFYSCSGSKVNTDKDFQRVAKEFIAAFDKKDLAVIEKYINSRTGFFVLDNPGAFSFPEYFTSYNQIVMLDSESGIGYLNHMKTKCGDITKGSVPVYSCDDERWDKEGCFYGEANSPGLSRLYMSLLQFELIDQTSFDSRIDLARNIDNQITHFIYSTDESVGFYFARINGEWKLLLIDKIVACSA